MLGVQVRLMGVEPLNVGRKSGAFLRNITDAPLNGARKAPSCRQLYNFLVNGSQKQIHWGGRRVYQCSASHQGQRVCNEGLFDGAVDGCPGREGRRMVNLYQPRPS